MSKPSPIGFAGTPKFALTVLQALVKAGYDPALVITQPDRPVGRSRDPQPSLVGRWAGQRFRVEKPETADELSSVLVKAELELLVVAAYGMILRKAALEAPAKGCLNVHASILPAYRGASPIQQALLDGQAETGVTIMLMDEGLDTGPILSQAKVPIEPDDDYLALSAKLAATGGALLVKTIPDYLSGKSQPKPQENSPTPLTRPLRRSDGVIDWEQPAKKILRHLRAFRPWPGATWVFDGQRIEILEAEEGTGPPLDPAEPTVENGNLLIGTGSRIPLLIRRLQPPGKRPMAAADWLRGYRGDGLLGQSANDSG